MVSFVILYILFHAFQSNILRRAHSLHQTASGIHGSETGNRTWGILSPWPRNVSDSTICIPSVRSGKSGIRPGLQGHLILSALLPSSTHLGLAKLSWWPMARAPTGLLPSHATLHDSICHRQRAQPAPCLRQPLLELRYQQGRIFSWRLTLFFLPLSVRPPSAVQQASCSPAVPWL